MRLSPVPATLFAAAGGAHLTDSLVPDPGRSPARRGAARAGPAATALPLRRVATGLGVFFVSPLVAASATTCSGRGPGDPGARAARRHDRGAPGGRAERARLTTLGLAFSACALVDHDRLVAAVSVAPRSALAVALATRLVPSLERDAAGLAEAVREGAFRSTAPAAMRGCSRRSSRARSSARRTWPRRWRRADSGTGAAPELRSRVVGARPRRRHRRGRPPGVGAVALARVEDLPSPIRRRPRLRSPACRSSSRQARSWHCSARRARASPRCSAPLPASTASLPRQALRGPGRGLRARHPSSAPGRARGLGRHGLPGS